MPITNGYITLADFKERMWSYGTPSSDAIRDTDIERMINGASRWVDNFCSRRFYSAIEIRYYTPEYWDLLFIDDLLTVTTLKTDDDDDRTYETTWLTTDYDLEPFNALVDVPPQAFNMIRVQINGDQVFPRWVRRGVEIAGSWGWVITETDSGATLSEDLDTSEPDIDVSDGTAFAIGMIIRIDSEDMFVDVIATNTLTARRGVNGSTAATHTTGATITILEPAQDISEACWLLAARLYKRKDAVLGVTANTALGQQTVRVPRDDDAVNLITPYIRSVP